jgi:hypothetical protein
MQRLLVVRRDSGSELYCDMCDSLFSEQFVKEHTQTFLDIHRDMHRQMSLNTPDLSENLDSYPQEN